MVHPRADYSPEARTAVLIRLRPERNHRSSGTRPASRALWPPGMDRTRPAARFGTRSTCSVWRTHVVASLAPEKLVLFLAASQAGGGAYRMLGQFSSCEIHNGEIDAAGC